MVIEEVTRDHVLRERAIKRLKKRRDFHAHLLIYAMVNTFLVGIWLLTEVHGFFWPVFPIAGWGIGFVMNAWDVYRGEDFGEEEIRREMDRLSKRRDSRFRAASSLGSWGLWAALAPGRAVGEARPRVGWPAEI